MKNEKKRRRKGIGKKLWLRSVKTLKNIWLPDFQLKYLEKEERYEFAVCSQWKNEESYTKRLLAKITHFELNMSRKITLKMEHVFCHFQAFCGKFDLVKCT